MKMELLGLKGGEPMATATCRRVGIVDGVPECLYWSEQERISNLQRMVMVHSIIYYNMNQSVIEDESFDRIARDLYNRQLAADDDVLRKTTYYYAFNDFNPASGYYLPSRLIKEDKEHLTTIANQVLYLVSKENANERSKKIRAEGTNE